MFGFGKRKKSKDKDKLNGQAPSVEEQVKTGVATESAIPATSKLEAAKVESVEPTLPVSEPSVPVLPEAEPSEPESSELAEKLLKTRRGSFDGMADFVGCKKEIDSNMLDELETTLLSAFFGIEATTEIIDTLQSQLSRKAISNPDALKLALEEIMTRLLEPCEKPLVIDTASKPYVILVVGINGAEIGRASCRERV